MGRIDRLNDCLSFLPVQPSMCVHACVEPRRQSPATFALPLNRRFEVYWYPQPSIIMLLLLLPLTQDPFWSDDF